MRNTATAASAHPIRFLISAFLLALGVPRTAAAQDVAELARRVDTLVAVRDAAVARRDAYERSAEQRRSASDTVALFGGALRIVTVRSLMPMARAAADSAERFIRRRAGDRIHALDGAVYGLWHDTLSQGERRVLLSPRADSLYTAKSSATARAAAVAVATIPALTHLLEGQLQNLVVGAPVPALARWLESSYLPVDTAADRDWRAVRLELASSPSVVARRCYDGDGEACKAALGLVAPPNDPILAWYDAAGRRLAVAGFVRINGLDPDMVSRCLAGVDAECIAVLHTSPAFSAWSQPLALSRARNTLIQEAFALAPPGALARLSASPDSISSALAAIAAVPVDSVLRRWMLDVHEHSVPSRNVPLGVVLTAGTWVVLFGGFSLRNTRWR